MCKRTTSDPLVRMFLDRYKINLLSVPRERAACGDVYLRRDGRVSSAINVAELLDPPVRLPPQFQGERLADLAGSLSQGVSLKVGLGLLEAFLAAIGAAAVLGELTLGYEQSRTSRLRFRFTDATRDSVEPGALATTLEGRRFRPGQPLVQPGNEYFVTAAVVRSPSISVVTEDDASRRVDVGARLLAAVDATANVTAEQASEGEITYRGRAPLAIGVELYRLRYDDDEQKLSMFPQDPRDPVHAGKPPPPVPAFVAPDDDALLEMAA
jgi:hypothetical protein